MLAADSLTGQLRDSQDLQFVDYIFLLKKTRGYWAVIEKIISYWIESNPSQYDSFILDVDKKRDTRATGFGSNKSKSFRSTLDIPAKIIQMIRVVYKADELPMDKKFFDEMWNRYPRFRVATKL
jgi:hypothetical protein